jgi:autotransporter-associated beta strand protein
MGAAQLVSAATNLSAWASPGVSGRLLAQPDPLGNRILDYSAVGYRNGTAPIPDVPVKITISPQAGDDGPLIQGAINYVKALPLDTNGFRGTVLLNAGEYDIAGSITIDASGVVLRGVGAATNGTVFRATGTSQRTLVVVSGSGSYSYSGTARNITNNYVPVGARSFNVDSTSGLAVGDRVVVFRPSTTNWIEDIGMDLLGPGSGGEADDVPWTAGSKDVNSDRIITRIEGNRIMLDAPLTCAIEAQYGGGTIRKFTWSGRINNVGVEDLRGVSDFSGPEDEAHAWTFVGLDSVENAWVRRVTSQYFGYACVALNSGSRTVTVRDCNSLDPVSVITGSRRYAFVMQGAQLCLMQNCYNLKDRHQFVTGSLTTGPNVFLDGQSDAAYSDAGPHHRWATGAIWDNVIVNGNNLNVQNRGNSGTGHGWAGANEVVWNSKANGFVVQNPPTARNWLIGSIGPIQNGTMWVGPHDPGTYDSHGSNVFPNSLYYAQLQDRLAAVKVETREYAVGEINQFATTSPTGAVVTVDAAWRTAIQTEAAGGAVNGFDIVTNNQFVPFTFNFTLAPTDRVVAATLALGLRAAASSTDEVLYLDSVGNTLTFSQLGWLPIGTGTNTTARLLDLHQQLSLLSDGKLNLAVRDDVGIDWATLELQIAPVQTLYTNVIPPAADASVRGGVYSGLNYGTNDILEIKADTTADTRRQAYLRWNLAGYSGRVLHARVRLRPVNVGTNGLEHGVTLAGSSSWNETALNWNNQPGGGKRFATWIPAGNTPVEFVVTPQVQAALAGDGLLGLELFSLKNVGAPGLVSYAARENADPALRPQLLLVVSNPVPNISVISDQAIPADATTGPIPFIISDPVYPVNQLTLGAISSDPALVPPGNLVLGGSLADRTLTVTPVSGQAGTVVITVTVTNPIGQTAATQFILSVTNNSGSELPASGNWAMNAGGDWSQAVNWSGGIIANGVDKTATFANDLTAPRFVNQNSSRSIGNLVFSDAAPGSAGAWFITNQPLTLAVSNGTPAIVVSNVTATISSVLDGAQGLNKQGDGTLVLAGINNYTGNTTVSSGALLVTSAAALGATSSGTTVQNPETARLELAENIIFAEPLTLACKGSALGNVPAVVNVSGTNTLSGVINLTTGGSFWTFEAAEGKLRVTGNPTNSTTTNVRTIWLRGGAEGEWLSVISDSAGDLATAVRKDDPGRWTLSGANYYTGNTIVSNGTLHINGTVRGPVNIYGGELGGTGLITAPVTIFSGAAFAPGSSVGTLSISNNLTLAAGSSTLAEIDAQALNCDLVRGLNNVVYGGTLVVTNRAGILVGGQTFQLFSAASFSGNFSSIVPATPGAGLMWNFVPATGTLSVVALLPPQINQFGFGPGNTFTLSGLGPTGASYRVLGATNLTVPLGSWTALSAGIFVGGVFSFVDPQATNHSQRFYRLSIP